MKTFFITIPNLSLILSGGYSFLFFVNLLKFWLLAILTKFKIYNPNIIFLFKYKSFQFKLNLTSFADLAVLVEVFLDEEYSWLLDSEPEVIVDLGAHFGDTALYYHSMYPNAKIFAVEPSPENFLRLEKHVSEINNIIPINAAVGAEDGELELNLSKSSLGHSMYVRESAGETVNVKMFSLNTFMSRYNVNHITLLKFDIEGAEFGVLKNLQNQDLVSNLIGELHFDLNKNIKMKDLITMLDGFECETEKILNFDQRYIIKARKIVQ